MVIQLEATANRGRVACSGAIEEPAIRDAMSTTPEQSSASGKMKNGCRSD